MDRSALIEWNPWWNTGKVPSNWLGRTRDDLDPLFDRMKSREVLIVTGIRRSGKTTLLFQIIDRLLRSGVPPKNILFANLNDASFTGITIDEIRDAYLQMYKPEGRAYYFLDEIQEIPGWERWALKGYELKRDDKIVVTGSSSVLLANEYASILTGRTSTITVYPLRFPEYIRFNDYSPPRIPTGDDRNILLFHLDTYLRRGGFPELHSREDAIPQNLLSGYFNDILVRDILLHNKVDAASMMKFSKYLMTNIAKPMTYRSLRNATDLSVDTIKSYISILEKVYMIWTLPYFSFSSKKTVEDQRPKKYYCIDNGIRNAVSFRFSDDSGRLAENLVYLELMKKGLSLGYWMESNEIDFVTMNGSGETELINVCFSDSIPDREFKGFREFVSAHGVPTKGMKILTRDIEEGREDIQLIPLWKWLLQ